MARGDAKRWLHNALMHESDECLLFPFGRFADGYGAVWSSGKMVKAHRFICEAAHGMPPSPEHHAAHSCGIRTCVNKRHLRWATRAENEADKVVHGRSNRGERQGHSVLTLSQVMQIKQATEPQRQIARRFGISPQQVCNIKKGRAWAWV
jgi:hypothetical protein